MNSRGYQSVTMERNVIIMLILISVFKSDLGFSSGEWFEIDGCHSLGAAIIQIQTNLSENEPGGCLEWCGTKTVALQNSSCFCINDTQSLNRTREDSCFQNCSGKEEIFKCGGNSSDIVSLYTERSDKFAELGPSNSSGCLTYSHTGELVTSLVPDTCNEKHPFYCYSETKFDPHDCYRHAVTTDKRTWYGALEACRSQFLQFLWPAQDMTTCSEMFPKEERYWVAVYQWTKVLPTSTTTSTTTTTSTLSTTLPTTTTTMTTSTTSTSSTISSTSTISETSTTTTARSTPSSASTSTSTSTKATSTTRLPTSSNDTESPRHEAAIFQIDPPNIGLGVGIGLLVGIVISITINFFRMRIKSHTPREMSSRSLTLPGIQHDAGRQNTENMLLAVSNGTAHTPPETSSGSLTPPGIQHDAETQQAAVSNGTAYASFNQLKGEKHDDTKL